MYFKFLNHGKGNASIAASYLLDEVDHLNRVRASVEVLAGDAKTFTAICDASPHKYKYTSAVIAWAEDDAPSREQIQEVLDEFEKHAFAGLDPQRYHMFAVMHEEDNQAKHIHILVPRIDLETGKALNIAPPGHSKYYDPLRNHFNYKYGWSRPDDPNRAKEIQLPDHVYMQRAAALKAGLKDGTRQETQEAVDAYIKAYVEMGFIKTQKDVIQALKSISNIKSVTPSKNAKTPFISIEVQGRKTAVRLKGVFYDSKFQIESYTADRKRTDLDAEPSERSRSISEEHNKLAEEHKTKFGKLRDNRSKYNEKYFGTNTANISSTELDRNGQQKSINFNEKSNYHLSEFNKRVKRNPSSERTTAAEHNGNFEGTQELENFAENSNNALSSSLSTSNFQNGEINDNFRQFNESTNSATSEREQAAESRNRGTRRHTDSLRELEQSINKTKQRLIEHKRDIESGLRKPKQNTALTKLLTAVSDQVRAAFTAAARAAFIAKFGQRGSSEANQSYSFTFESEAIENFGTRFKRAISNHVSRVSEFISDIRNTSQRADSISQSTASLVSSLQKKPLLPISHSAVSKPLHTFSDLFEFSQKCDIKFNKIKELMVTFRKEERISIDQVADALLNYLSSVQEKNVFLGDKLNRAGDLCKQDIDIIEKIIKNDSCHQKIIEDCFPKLEEKLMNQRQDSRLTDVKKSLTESNRLIESCVEYDKKQLFKKKEPSLKENNYSALDEIEQNRENERVFKSKNDDYSPKF